MGMIYLKNLRMHAFHGVLPQERAVGNDYTVNLAVDFPTEKACLSDNVADTMNYAEAAEVVVAEMQRPSNLLENVAYRIAKGILSRFPQAGSATVDIQKTAPPMPVALDGAGVSITLKQGSDERRARN